MPSFTTMLLIMAAAAFACRAAGYLVVSFLPQSARLESALRATPLSVMAGITALAVVNGTLADAMALGSVVALTFLIGNDLIAALAGVAIVALLRSLGL